MTYNQVLEKGKYDAGHTTSYHHTYRIFFENHEIMVNIRKDDFSLVLCLFYYSLVVSGAGAKRSSNLEMHSKLKANQN